MSVAMLGCKSSFFSVFISLVCLIMSCAAQSKAPEPSTPQVDIAFAAFDQHGKPVSGINASDLKILDNKISAPAKRIQTRPGLGLHLGVLIDISNSERASTVFAATVRDAWDFLTRILNDKDDRVFVEKFHHLPDATPLLTKRQFLEQKIDLTLEGGTALYDALVFACNDRLKIESDQPRLRVVVLLSDGDDDQSHSTREQAIAAAQAAGVVVFAISTQDENSHFTYGGASGNRTLEHIADKTGGTAFLHLSVKSIPKVFATIEEQIRSMYVVSYNVPNPSSDGEYRSVEITIVSQTKLKFRAPKGYYRGATSPR
jgi:VWFA-related protein